MRRSNTFGSNSILLKKSFALADRVREINKRVAELM